MLKELLVKVHCLTDSKEFFLLNEASCMYQAPFLLLRSSDTLSEKQRRTKQKAKPCSYQAHSLVWESITILREDWQVQIFKEASASGHTVMD